MSSVRINLLPDLRQAKLRERNYRRLAVSMTVVTVSVCLALIILVLLIILSQRVRIASLTDSIKERHSAISKVADLDKILTTQQHLAALPGLYSQRVYLTRLYAVLGTFTPQDVSLQSLDLDRSNVLKLSARARNYYTATKFSKALEASSPTATVNGQPAAFSNVTLSAVSAEADGKVSFSVTANMQPEVTNGQD